MSSAPIELTLPEFSTAASSVPISRSQRSSGDSRFSKLRGVQWRINLGILPSSSSSSSIEELRRLTADSRRRYAGLRRRLLVDQHFPKDGSNSPDLVVDNPLSQDPDSTWGRFFRNTELEKMVDQDLSRLYPEHGSYFQTPACQHMLRRILLLWCLRHPEHGYRQGMHELLAPLLYVLHVDVQHLSQVRKLYEDHFIDKFDGESFPGSDLICNYKVKWGMSTDDDESSYKESATNVRSLEELDPEVQTVVLLSDAYGAEGELGILMSERFLEHDAYCMFEALMSGAYGAVAMADFFSPAPAIGSNTGLPPVIETSSAVYHLLSIVDSSLYSHLVELGVEPQYFALRWLRVLFGREFVLEDLLIIWDEIFASNNGKLLSTGAEDDDAGSSFGVLGSPRGAFISAMAVSMLLHLRSSLLATEHATSCLQRLLNFPENINVKKLIEKAKSLQTLALDSGISSPPLSLNGSLDRSKSAVVRGYSPPFGSVSPRTPLSMVPESYWEEKWRVLHKAEELRQGSPGAGKKGSSEKVRLSLARAESAPSPANTAKRKRDSRSSVRRSLLEDLSRELGAEEDLEKTECNGISCPKNPLLVEIKVEGESIFNEESSSIFSASSSPLGRAIDHENDSDKSSVVSNLSIDDNDGEHNNEDPCGSNSEDPPFPVSCPVGEASLLKSGSSTDATGKQLTSLKERKLLSGKFQWFWKFGRNAGEGTSEKGSASEASEPANVESNQNDVSGSPTPGFISSSTADAIDKNVMGSLKNIGQSMLENIQVIESVFQQDRSQAGSSDNFSKNVLVEKGQVTAMTALKELRKISNILSEML